MKTGSVSAWVWFLQSLKQMSDKNKIGSILTSKDYIVSALMF